MITWVAQGCPPPPLQFYSFGVCYGRCTNYYYYYLLHSPHSLVYITVLRWDCCWNLSGRAWRWECGWRRVSSKKPAWDNKPGERGYSIHVHVAPLTNDTLRFKHHTHTHSHSHSHSHTHTHTQVQIPIVADCDCQCSARLRSPTDEANIRAITNP